MRLLIAFILLLCSSFAGANDWPAGRHDAGRSGATDEQLPATLHLQWSRKLPQLTPAWPEDVRLHFDDSYLPIVVGKLMIVASSHNDSVTAYDTDSGGQKWRFYAGGPVRFAPVAHEGNIYFGSDDGHLYRLNADDGNLLSKIEVAPAKRLALGNDRLISVWPIRGGPVIVGDKLHFTVGVWPFEGTYLTSLDLKDNTTMAPLTPLDDSTPQGYLVSNGERLIIPGGRATADCRDLTSGKQIILKYTARGLTDHHIVVHDQWMFHGGRGVNLETAKQLDFDALRPLVSNGKVYFSRGGEAHAYNLSNLEAVEKLDRKGKPYKVTAPALLWKYAEQPVTELHLKTAKRVFGHHQKKIFSIAEPQDGTTAKASFSAELEGTCANMLAADGKLFVVTKEGQIYCYGSEKAAVKNHKEEVESLTKNPDWERKAGAILQQAKVEAGYGLSLGIGSGGLIEELLRQSELTFVAIDPDAEKVEDFRRRMDKKGLYGNRVVALQGTPDTLHLPPYLASLLVSEDIGIVTNNDKSLNRAFRTMRPYGGVACFEMTADQHQAFVEKTESSKLVNAVVARNGQWTTLTREGALPGSANWTHEYGDESNTLTSQDKLVKAPMGVLWYGGPSSSGDLFYNRHYWGPSATIIDGRMFIQGPSKLTAVDVYTGRILWKIELQEREKLERRAGRRGWNFEDVIAGFHFAASSEGIYIVDGEKIIYLDPTSGKQLGTFTHPDKGVEWGRPLIHDDMLIVSAFRDTEEYGHIPAELVALDKRSGEVRWTTKAKLSFPVFALGKDKLFCFDGAIQDFYDIKIRRGALPTAAEEKLLRAIDLKTGKDLWTERTDIVATWLSYSKERDVMVVSNKEKIATFRGETGESLWRKYSDGKGFKGHPENYWDKVILWKDRIIDQRGPGLAYDLETGDDILRKNTLTGEDDPWSFTKSGHHCNYAIASEHLMTFRAGDAAFCDLETGATAQFEGFRSGCRNSLIPANGILNAPNFAHGCVCSYSLFTSLALMHVPESDMWSYSAYKAGDGPVQQLGVNFGARGDRTAPNGTLWIDYPGEEEIPVPNIGGKPVAVGSPDVPIHVTSKTATNQYFRIPSIQVTGQGLNWVASSGIRDLTSVKIPLALGKSPDKLLPTKYTVRLSFVEPDTNTNAGQRVFDVTIQGKAALPDFDIAKESGATHKVLVKEFTGIAANGELSINFVAKKGSTLVSGIELIAEE